VIGSLSWLEMMVFLSACAKNAMEYRDEGGVHSCHV
jgi:hypothetical protein